MGFQPWQAQVAILFLLLLHLLPSSSAQDNPYTCSHNRINYTSNSVYDANLNSILSNLSQNIDDNGFYNASAGRTPDRANVIALCRGDAQLDGCRSCVQDATAELLRGCPNQKQGVIFYEFCLLRFSNVSIFGAFVSSPMFFLYNTQNATSPNQFVTDRGIHIRNLSGVAAGGGPRRKVAFGVTNTSGFQEIYAIVQCSPDLFPDDCNSCLNELDRTQMAYCGTSIGCRALGPSCNFRYETLPFYNETRLQEFLETSPNTTLPQPPQLPPTTPAPVQPGKKGNNSARTIIIVVVASLTFLIAASCIFIIIKRMKKKPYQEIDNVDGIQSADSLQFDFGDMKTATNDFSDANKLGKGGFGSVYKGKLENGLEIAVKRLSTESGQGDVEFKNEVLLVAKLQHRNLVRLLGFSIQMKERLLVYEFVKNASLDQFLFDPTKRSELHWERRIKIIGGIARGLLYLHEESRLRIIHRDLKASNVLLDDDMNPKIADFGLARLFVADETHGNTNRIVGTYGYMSPEYAMHGQFSTKSDVFSFGVIVLEIISGQKNNSFRRGENIEDLLSSAWKLWNQGKAIEVIDPVLRANTSNHRDILRSIHIGLLCVQENPSDRPTIASVVLMLSSQTISLAVPNEPAFFVDTGGGSKNALFRGYDSKELESSESYSNNKSAEWMRSSRNDFSVTELYPR